LLIFLATLGVDHFGFSVGVAVGEIITSSAGPEILVVQTTKFGPLFHGKKKEQILFLQLSLKKNVLT
jgi:hypothetical protein